MGGAGTNHAEVALEVLNGGFVKAERNALEAIVGGDENVGDTAVRRNAGKRNVHIAHRGDVRFRIHEVRKRGETRQRFLARINRAGDQLVIVGGQRAHRDNQVFKLENRLARLRADDGTVRGDRPRLGGADEIYVVRVRIGDDVLNRSQTAKVTDGVRNLNVVCRAFTKQRIICF